MAFKIAFASLVGMALLVALQAFPDPEPTRGPAILRGISPRGGHSYLSILPRMMWSKLSTEEDFASSEIILYEDGKPLPLPHSDYNDVAYLGGGRYYVGGKSPGSYVVFSASDNSDPNTNGRTYRVINPKAVDPYKP